MTKSGKQLYRPEEGKMIAGVCLGLANYFDIDPIIIRVIFVIITIGGGAGVLAYLILWLVMPSKASLGKSAEENIKDGAEEIKSAAEKFGQGDKNTIVGIALLVLGLTFLLSNFGIINQMFLSKLWPLALVILGFIILTKHGKR